ncbi:MAG: hypothetical protein QNI99_14780 [Woeseiaceae bacterium]|nr:hypothetical protein [Woeseiaceae bacterium]
MTQSGRCLLIDSGGEMKRLPLMIMILASLAGCAEGSALIVGQTRPAIENPESIRILTEMPDGAEQIAFVKASSDDGWTQQGDLDLAVAELKRQAAKVGANAIVLTSHQTESQVVGIPQSDGGTQIGTSEKQVVEGIAVWVD